MRASTVTSVSFGMVSVPVKLYNSYASENGWYANTLHATCKNRINQYNWCNTCDCSPEETLKGYPVSKTKFAIFTKDEAEALAEEGKGIVVKEFVPLDSIDPIYYDKSYFLGIGKDGESAYSLLCAAMTKQGVVAIAEFTARGKMYVVAIRPYEDGMAMHQLIFDDNLRAFEEVPGMEEGIDAPDDKAVTLAAKLVEEYTSEYFDASGYKDEAAIRLDKAIKDKSKGKKLATVRGTKKKTGKVLDMMDLLQKSVDGAKKTKKKATKKTTTKKTAKKGKK